MRNEEGGHKEVVHVNEFVVRCWPACTGNALIVSSQQPLFTNSFPLTPPVTFLSLTHSLLYFFFFYSAVLRIYYSFIDLLLHSRTAPFPEAQRALVYETPKHYIKTPPGKTSKILASFKNKCVRVLHPMAFTVRLARGWA